MAFWLGQACREARKDVDVKQGDVALRAGVVQQTVIRFERPMDVWPRELDALLRAYAIECDVDEYDLWSRALDLARQG